MDNLSIRDITADNWRDCIRLQLEEEQKKFIAPNVMSLAQAAYETHCTPKAVYVDDEMVGFMMYGIEFYEGRDVWDIIRVMTDKQHQGKGYGRVAIQKLLKMMKVERPDMSDVYISFILGNEAARHVYTKIGFKDVGLAPDGYEILMHYKLT